MEDKEIVAMYWRRSEDAIPASQRKYGAYCRSIANNILHSAEDAEECLNDTWLKAWNSMPDHRPTHLGPYLGKLTRWLALTKRRAHGALRRGGGETPLALEELSEALPDNSDTQRTLELKELSRAVRRFLDGLGATEREVFLSRYWYMAGVGEIAEKFGFTPNKVSTMLHRTRRKLRTYLKEEGLC